ncbi:hypothetical protein [Comamonas sp. HJ-2]
MRHFLINQLRYSAADCVQGILIDPQLPADFDSTPNDDRPPEQMAMWGMPYIVSNGAGRYDVRCLDGGAWDRSTWKGQAATIEAAVELARHLLAHPRVDELHPLDGSLSNGFSVSILMGPDEEVLKRYGR